MYESTAEKANILENIIDEPMNWERPIPFDEIVLPTFPIECMPTVIRDYIIEVSEATQTPIDMSAVAGLCIMALCVQGKYKIQGKPDWKEPLNLYTVIIAPPAERKSAIMALLTKYIYEYENETNDRLKPVIEQNKSEKNMLLNDLKRAENKGEKPKAMELSEEVALFEEMKPLRLTTGDVSPEKLISLMADNNGKIGVISAEGGIFEVMSGKYSSDKINIDVFLQAHAGDMIRVDRIGRPSDYVKDPTLTMLLAIQPEVLEKVMSNNAFNGRGLTGRFLYCKPISNIGNRKFSTASISEISKENFKDLIYTLLDIEKQERPQIIELSKEAFAIIEQFFYMLEPRLIDDLEPIKNWAGKCNGVVLRIAGILHCIEHKQNADKIQVSAEIMNNAISIGEYFLEHAKNVFLTMGANENVSNAQYVLSKLKKNTYTQLKKCDILKICRKFKKVDELTPIIDTLIEYGYIKEYEQMYYISPYIYVNNVNNVNETNKIHQIHTIHTQPNIKNFAHLLEGEA